MRRAFGVDEEIQRDEAGASERADHRARRRVHLGVGKAPDIGARAGVGGIAPRGDEVGALALDALLAIRDAKREFAGDEALQHQRRRVGEPEAGEEAERGLGARVDRAALERARERGLVAADRDAGPARGLSRFSTTG